MFVPDFSLVATRRRYNERDAVRRLRLGLSAVLTAMLAISANVGCRTPWRSPAGDPSFDRLIEIEQRSGPPRSGGHQPQAAHLRPGPAKYAMHGNSQDGNSQDDSSQDILPAAATSAASQSLSDRGEETISRTSAAVQDLNDLEDMLVDVPPAQRELLRREMTTMQRVAQGHVDIKRRPIADPLLAAHKRGPSSTAGSDRPSDREDYTGSSKYQLADKVANRQPGAPDISAPDISAHDSDQAYSRRLSDRTDAPPQLAKTTTEFSTKTTEDALDTAVSKLDTVVSKPAARPTEDAGVVTASYAADAQPSEKTPAIAAHSEPLDWRQHITAALAELESQSTAASPEEQVHLQMVDRLLHMSLGDIEAASEPIEGLQTGGQDFIRHSIKSLHDVTNPTGNPVETKRYTLAMLSQRQAMSQLASVSNLEVRNATFCTEVDGFGVVTKFPQYAFKPDQELLLYCELDNFVSTQLEGKGYETQLQGSYEIVDSNGRRVADQMLPLDSHLCRNQRRDYFIAYRIYMPQQIAAGKYQLKLTVEDIKGRKFGQSVLDFQIQ